MKQTAVEWLLDWMDNNQYFIGNDLLQAVEKAKEMEKKQIVDAYDKGEFNQGCNGDAEQYYKETFKQD